MQARIKNLLATLVGDDDPKREQRLLRELAEQREDEGIAMEARWRLAWHDIGDRKLQSALRWLEPLTRGSKWDAEVQRARYWAAVAREKIDPAEGARELREIAEGLPLTYYGMLAADRLGTSGAIERSLLEPPTSISEPRAARRARLLASAGYEDLAQLELRSWVNQPSLTREDRLIAAQQLHALGNHFAAVQLVVSGFGGTLDEGIDPLWRDAWSSAWPQPFESLVRAAVMEFDFDEALVYAIMREESLYRRDVESVAGARGLMQLIPPTAKRIASVLAVPDFTPDALYEPATNVRFGTYYLKELVDEFGGSRPYAIAAYNAGPEAVRKWLGRGGSVPDDRFVDSVPYGETRRYLRRVLRSYRVYQLLYAEPRQHAANQAK
jgi:soluble lytic murein transglycosylase